MTSKTKARLFRCWLASIALMFLAAISLWIEYLIEKDATAIAFLAGGIWIAAFGVAFQSIFLEEYK